MPLLSLSDARALIAQHVQPLDAVALPLAAAIGAPLREAVTAPEDMPMFDRSAMDGYALAVDDLSERFRVVGEIQAGAVPAMTLRTGECARIFTGAEIPEGATQVMMQEDTKREGEWMIPQRRDSRPWIRRRGEDARQGDLLLEAGTRLQAGDLALLAQIGVTTPRVSRPVQVLHFTTGDELVDPATVPGRGQIRDSNSTLIHALLAASGGQVKASGRCGDELAAMVAAIESNPEGEWDLLLISGGASVGDYDFGARTLEQLGFTIHFRQLNLRPGKPLIFATRGRQVAFVIPGNPVSHFVTFHVAIRLALECLLGIEPWWPMVEVELAGDVTLKAEARDTWWPVAVRVEAGRLKAFPRTWQSSGDSRGLIGVNGLLPIPSAGGDKMAGTLVECLLVDRL